MCTSSATAPIPWPNYLSRQKLADSQVLNSFAFGRDEQLSEILDKFESGEPISGVSIDRLERNRARKFRQRRKKLLEVVACWDQVIEDGEDAFDSAVANEQLEWIRLNTNTLELRCLWLQASGETYEQIAAKVAMKANSLRSLVARCRARLRELAIPA